MTKFIIRKADLDDVEEIAKIEATCFPVAEAAGRETIRGRIMAFPECFLVAETTGKLIGFVNGCATNSPVIYDELFYSTKYHEPDGENYAVFGLDVLPDFRRRGIAKVLMHAYIQAAKDSGRKSVILTCKKPLLSFYESFGYVNSGISKSTHGAAAWFDMTLVI